ncbi:MAG: NADH-quinone oxidoreductase subunit J family protein, partial [Kofleriaceae bacterium]
APAALMYPGATEAISWGGVKSVGLDLFGPGLFPFEAISILRLVAVVGAIAIARPLHEDAVPKDPNNPNDPAVEGHSV